MQTNPIYIEMNISDYTGYHRDKLQWAGLFTVIGLYVIVFIIGIYASWKTKFWAKKTSVDELMLANRNIGPILGTFTLTGREIILNLIANKYLVHVLYDNFCTSLLDNSLPFVNLRLLLGCT